MPYARAESMVRISSNPCRRRFNSPEECPGNGNGACVLFSTRNCCRAPAMVNPSSYNNCLMRSTVSTSLRRYMRWPVLLLTGFNWANSVSQKRNTYAGNLQSVETSPIRKYSLSGIMTSSFRDALLDFGRALMRNSILHYNAFRVSSTIGGAEQALEPTKNLSRGVSVERPGKTCTRVLLAFSAFSF